MIQEETTRTMDSLMSEMYFYLIKAGYCFCDQNRMNENIKNQNK